jgi:hypothetical protein
LAEGAVLCSARICVGDDAVREIAQEQMSEEELARFAERHPNQVASLLSE